MLTLALFLFTATTPPPLTAEDIAARYVDAVGGQERLRQIRTLIYRGTYREGDYQSPRAAMALMRPYYKLVGDPAKPVGDFAEGYDGGAWEYYGSPGVVLRTVGAANAAIRHRASVTHPLVDYREESTRLEMLAPVVVNGRDAYRLRMTMRDGFAEEILLDPQTFLIVAERKSAPVHAEGQPVRTETRISDYKRVAGVLLPHKFEEVEIATGKQLNAVEWRSIEANVEIDAARFSPPSFQRTPLQHLLERLFEQRTDREAVLWSFHEFRRLYPEVEMTKALQFITRQMKKMGDGIEAAEALQAALAAG